MKPMIVPLLALWMLSSPALHATSAADTPEHYSAHWPLEVPADSALVRLPLPAEVLSQVQTAELRDLRIFNSEGQAVPLALAPGRHQTSTPAAIDLPVLPIQSEPRQAVGDASGMSLRIEDSPSGRVVRLDSSSTAAQPDSDAGTERILLGMLVDTREQEQALAAIELDAHWPEARPFTFRIDTSPDLRQWQALTQITAYRAPDGTVLAPAHAKLNATSLKSLYLRITWDATTTPEEVQLHGVRLLPKADSSMPRQAVAVRLPQAQPQDGALEWRLPFAVPLAALEVRLGETPALISMRVLARQHREQAWTLLGRHVAFNLLLEGQTQHSQPLELRRTGSWRDWRLEVDPGTSGFTSTPQLIAWLNPQQLVFVATGTPPFSLAAGRPDASPVLLPLSKLMSYTDHPAADLEPRLPVAHVTVAPEGSVIVTALRADTQPDLQRWILWFILIAGVLVLAALVWLLTRPLSGSDTASKESNPIR